MAYLLPSWIDFYKIFSFEVKESNMGIVLNTLAQDRSCLANSPFSREIAMADPVFDYDLITEYLLQINLSHRLL